VPICRRQIGGCGGWVVVFEKYGLKATEETFSVKKSSIYKWRKLLKENQGR
jgi:hypothetical protein